MKFTREKTVGTVVERTFELQVAGERVPGVVWAAEGARGARPLVLMGHGGTQHKKTENIRARANAYAAKEGWVVAAIDAPGHGDRVSRDEAARNAERARTARGRLDPERMKRMAERGRQAVPEWKATLDALQTLDWVGHGPVGYWGVSMGTAIGVPFVASEPRILCAVFGLAGLRPGATEFETAARSITVPVRFAFQWDDAVAPREAGIALFDAFGSKDKSMHIHPGGHLEIPAHEAASWRAFFARHLAS